MELRVTNKVQSGMPPVLQKWLEPAHLLCLASANPGGVWEELHLRVGRCASVTVAGENRRLPLILNREQMHALVCRLCGDSLYAWQDAINRGFLPVGEGVRVGICGQAVRQGGEAGDGTDSGAWSVSEVDSLCLRFPHSPAVGQGVFPSLRHFFPRGVLFYAPPGVGKTTLLRAVACHFAGGETPWRVAVVDSRCELQAESFGEDLCLNILSGYPKGRGIDIALRTFNPQLILCDELAPDDCDAVRRAAGGGVPLVAAAHGDSIRTLLARPGLRNLHRAGVFGGYIGIRRGESGGDYFYTVTAAEDACVG